MISSFLSKSTSTRNWSTIGIEFLVVVFGILLALGVDEWRTNKSERAEELEILLALNKDITASIGQVDVALYEIDLITDALKYLAAANTEIGGTVDRQELDFQIVNALWETGLYAPEMSTYAELINTGKMNIIDEVGIRRGLARYERSLQLSLAMYQDVFEHQQNKLDMYVIANTRMPQALATQSDRRDDRNYALPTTGVSRDHSELLGEELFQNHVAAKFFLIREYERYTEYVRQALNELQVLVLARIAVLEGR